MPKSLVEHSAPGEVMFIVRDEDRAYLRRRVEKGELILVLGAGAVMGCTNKDGKPLKSANQLAAELCNEFGVPYDGETLGVVLDAIKPPTAQLNEILVNEYRGCTPSEE